MSEAKGILIYGEFLGERLLPITLELSSIGRKLADELNQELGIVFSGSGVPASLLQEAVSYGANKVYIIDQPLLNDNPEALVSVLDKVCTDLNPDIFLLGQTSIGRDLAPRLAFRLKTRLVMDCVDLKIDPQSQLLVRIKPVYGSKAHASFVSKARPQIATLRAKSVPISQPNASHKGEIVPLEISFDPSLTKAKVVSRVEDKEGVGKRLESASVIVCGGRGIGSTQNFVMLDELANLLKGAVGTTRPPCDLGWVSTDLQIGMTGKMVAPALYIAVALSGSSAHLAGCGNARNIIAINKDPEANIFRTANYGIVADFKEVLPIIIEKCRNAASGQ